MVYLSLEKHNIPLHSEFERKEVENMLNLAKRIKELVDGLWTWWTQLEIAQEERKYFENYMQYAAD